ncbi:MAG: nucleotide exchange factor GrpE [Clostridia bacterium]|nr:nucleotide exchange factor GrpE [Clostridia bacterium]
MEKENIVSEEIIADEKLNANESCKCESSVDDKAKKSSKKKNCEKELIQQIENLRAENTELAKKADEYKQSWYRTAADFDNFRKRNNETRANAYFDGKSDAIKSILIVGDNLDRALNSISASDEQTKNGIELVIKQFGEILKNMGVEEINPVGEVFDPNLHEAVHQIEALEGEESGTVKSVFKKGYRLSGKMIRYAQVIVVK